MYYINSLGQLCDVDRVIADKIDHLVRIDNLRCLYLFNNNITFYVNIGCQYYKWTFSVPGFLPVKKFYAYKYSSCIFVFVRNGKKSYVFTLDYSVNPIRINIADGTYTGSKIKQLNNGLIIGDKYTSGYNLVTIKNDEEYLFAGPDIHHIKNKPILLEHGDYKIEVSEKDVTRLLNNYVLIHKLKLYYVSLPNDEKHYISYQYVDDLADAMYKKTVCGGYLFRHSQGVYFVDNDAVYECNEQEFQTVNEFCLF
jgi:hypothetical protein